ncbi:hypothetical protein [Gracilibacillus oryzae]|uniref:hypothetical protein n=1 Tax=Gracilibacillus oryzae TaxID=1672701 RepID=UPI0012965EE7|nr:hypothetical protein [Gracilibacillus oryzae]
MFKNAEKLSKCLDQLIKVTEELENQERIDELVNVIHQLSIVHQNVLGDLINKTVD